MERREITSGSLGLDGNLNKKVNPVLPDDGLYKIQGFHLDEALSVTKWNGFQKYNSVQLLETGTGATFTGIFDYFKSDGTSQKLAMGLTGFYRYGSPSANTWNSLSLTGAGGARTGTANDLFDAAVLEDLFIAGNGIDSNLKYNGTTVYNLGIAAPGSAATAADGGGTGLTGVYSYKVTFYNSAMGHESNPSAKSNDVNITNKQVSLTAIPVSTDAQVNQRRIYRTTAGGAIWLFLATINDNVTTTYTDSAADSTLGVAVDTTGNGVPPTFSMIEIWKNRAFTVAPNASRIWFSKSGKPNAVDSNDYRDLDSNDGDIITGVGRLFDTLVVFKNDSIWNGFGDTRNDFGFDRQVTGVGSVNNACILNVPGRNVLAFLEESGKFYFYDGTREIPTGLGVQKDLEGLNQSLLAKAVGCVYKKRNLCLWVVPNGASTQNDLLIWYDYLLNKWGTREISNVKANFISILEDDSSRESFYTGGYGGHVWVGDSGGSDDAANISCEIIDRAHPRIGDNPLPGADQTKSFYEIVVYFKPTAGTTITVSGAVNDPDNAYTVFGTIDASSTRGQGTVRFNIQGTRLFPKIAESSTLQGLVIRGWQVKCKVIGRQY